MKLTLLPNHPDVGVDPDGNVWVNVRGDKWDCPFPSTTPEQRLALAGRGISAELSYLRMQRILLLQSVTGAGTERTAAFVDTLSSLAVRRSRQAA